MIRKIPVFVSAPSALSLDQQKTYDEIVQLMGDENFEPRALGRSEYPSEYPLREVAIIASHCSGGIILGFKQIFCPSAIFKQGTSEERRRKNAAFSTPWNQLEAGILYGMRIPLMVFREGGISGGVFDEGVTDVFVQNLPLGGFSADGRLQLKSAVQNWAGLVREKYRAWR